MNKNEPDSWAEAVLQQARELVQLLEQGDEAQAQALLEQMRGGKESELFTEVGKLTRQLHEALLGFQLDTRITNLAAQEMPDARERLNYVITMTEDAANRTMDGLEKCMPMVDGLNRSVVDFREQMQRLFRKEMQPGEFREMCDNLVSHFNKTENQLDEMHAILNDITLAQGFQDLTGQVIRRVISLVTEVEASLVQLIKMFGTMTEYSDAKTKGKEVTKGVEGPVIDKARQDVVQGQDDVDALLSSLGF